MTEPSFDNRLRRTLRPLARWRAAVGEPLRSLLIGRTIPLVGTASLRIERLDEDEVVVFLANRRHVRNHIGTLHAAAMALVAETASGLALGMHVRDDAVPVIQRMAVKFDKRAQGDTARGGADPRRRNRAAAQRAAWRAAGTGDGYRRGWPVTNPL